MRKVLSIIKEKKIIMIVILLMGSLLLFSDVKNDIFNNKKENTSVINLKGANAFRYVNLDGLDFQYINSDKKNSITEINIISNVHGLLNTDRIEKIDVVINKIKDNHQEESKIISHTGSDQTFKINNQDNFVNFNDEEISFEIYVDVYISGQNKIFSNKKVVSYKNNQLIFNDVFGRLESVEPSFDDAWGLFNVSFKGEISDAEDKYAYVHIKNITENSEWEYSHSILVDEEGTFEEVEDSFSKPIGKYLAYISDDIRIDEGEINRSQIIEFDLFPTSEIETDCTMCSLELNNTLNLNTRMSNNYSQSDKTTDFKYEITQGNDIINIKDNGEITALKNGVATVKISKPTVNGGYDNYVFTKEIVVYVGISRNPTLTATNNSIRVIAGQGNYKKWNIKYCEYNDEESKSNCTQNLGNLNDYDVKDLSNINPIYEIKELKANQRYLVLITTTDENNENLTNSVIDIYTKYNRPHKPQYAQSLNTEDKWYNEEIDHLCININTAYRDEETDYKYQYALTTSLNTNLKFQEINLNTGCNLPNLVSVKMNQLQNGENYFYSKIVPKDVSKNNESDISEPLKIQYDDVKPIINKIESEFVMESNKKNVKVTITATDEYSQVAKYQYKIEGENSWVDFSKNSHTFELLDKNVEFRAVDKAENTSDIKKIFVGEQSVKLEEESSYEIEKSTDEEVLFISNITKNTNIADFKNNFSAFQAKIYNKNATVDKSGRVSQGDEITSGKIGTGMLIVPDNFQNVYRAVVKGDLTGDGEINIADATKSLKSIATTVKTLEDYEEKAADVTGDKKLAVNDVVKIAKFLVKKADI